jgi:hypothetical protein
MTDIDTGYDLLAFKLHNSGSASDVLMTLRSVVERQLEILALEDRDTDFTVAGAKRKKPTARLQPSGTAAQRAARVGETITTSPA